MKGTVLFVGFCVGVIALYEWVVSLAGQEWLPAATAVAGMIIGAAIVLYAEYMYHPGRG